MSGSFVYIHCIPIIFLLLLSLVQCVFITVPILFYVLGDITSCVFVGVISLLFVHAFIQQETMNLHVLVGWPRSGFGQFKRMCTEFPDNFARVRYPSRILLIVHLSEICSQHSETACVMLLNFLNNPFWGPANQVYPLVGYANVSGKNKHWHHGLTC